MHHLQCLGPELPPVSTAPTRTAMGGCDTLLHLCMPHSPPLCCQTLPLLRPCSLLLPFLCQMPWTPSLASCQVPSLLPGAHKHTQGHVLVSEQLQLSRQGPLAK